MVYEEFWALCFFCSLGSTGMGSECHHHLLLFTWTPLKFPNASMHASADLDATIINRNPVPSCIFSSLITISNLARLSTSIISTDNDRLNPKMQKLRKLVMQKLAKGFQMVCSSGMNPRQPCIVLYGFLCELSRIEVVTEQLDAEQLH